VPKPRSKLAEVLEDLSTGLGELGVGWYLFGAQAALLYGAARLTADVDVTVALGQLATEKLVAVLQSSSFELRIDDQEFVRKTRVLPILHVPTRMPVDVVLAGPGLEELFLERAETRDVAGAHVPVARPEDVIVMKVLAGREKDRADIEAVLLAQRATIDLEMIRDTLSLLERALDHADLTPAFEAALRRVDELA
jgi:hypothetical protein